MSVPHRQKPLRALQKSIAATLIVGALCAAAAGIRISHPASGFAGATATGPLDPVRGHAMLRKAVRPEPGPVTAAPQAVVASHGCVNVPILVYHYIRLNPVPSDKLGFGLSVTPAEFLAQMDWLRLSGGHPVTMHQVLAAMSGGPPLPKHPVVLTFDDGYADFASVAVPVLQREGFVATDYVVGGFIGRPGYMTAAQVRQVAADGMVIGAHTMHHVDLASDPPSLAWIEISASRALLQQLLQRPVSDFAYPYGDVDGVVEWLTQRAGFSDAMTMNAGTLQCSGARYLLPRIRVGGYDTVASFARNAEIPPPPVTWVDPGAPFAGPLLSRSR